MYSLNTDEITPLLTAQWDVPSTSEKVYSTLESGIGKLFQNHLILLSDPLQLVHWNLNHKEISFNGLYYFLPSSHLFPWRSIVFTIHFHEGR